MSCDGQHARRTRRVWTKIRLKLQGKKKIRSVAPRACCKGAPLPTAASPVVGDREPSPVSYATSRWHGAVYCPLVCLLSTRAPSTASAARQPSVVTLPAACRAHRQPKGAPAHTRAHIIKRCVQRWATRQQHATCTNNSPPRASVAPTGGLVSWHIFSSAPQRRQSGGCATTATTPAPLLSPLVQSI